MAEHSCWVLLWCRCDVWVLRVCCRVGVGVEGEVGRSRYGKKREGGCGGGSRILTRREAAFVLIPIATFLFSDWLLVQVKVKSLL
jgi:hypothetical protein